MYTFLWRMTPHPLLGVFDTPEATSTCTRRMRSNTPLQSLTLLNDKAFTEFSQALAARVLNAKLPTDEARLDHLFRLCTARHPTAEESAILAAVLSKESASFKQNLEEAATVIKGSPVTIEDTTKHAAWTLVARVVLNLDETITRE
jgi:hypothetical protein